MSINIVDYPVKSVGKNVFAGKSPVQIKFKREDEPITGTGLGDDGNLLITLTADLTNSLNVGEYVYVNSEDYDTTAKVLEITSTTVLVEFQWLGLPTTGGYINYKQNYYLELDLIRPENEAAKILPFTLRDNGTPSGNIVIDLSVVNDLNELNYPDYKVFSEMEDSRVKFDIRYREEWRESSNSPYLRISDPIIIYPALKSGAIEDFSNEFDLPEYYKGYPNGAVFLHSDSAPLGAPLLIAYYDEKDINGDILKLNQKIGELAGLEVYGRLFAPLEDLPLLTDTKFITLKTESTNIPEFSPDDFTNDFKID